MVPELGHVSYDDDVNPLLGGVAGYTRSRLYSDETAREIDNAVREVTARAFELAYGILSRRRPVLEAAAAELLERETLDENDLDATRRYETTGRRGVGNEPERSWNGAHRRAVKARFRSAILRPYTELHLARGHEAWAAGDCRYSRRVRGKPTKARDDNMLGQPRFTAKLVVTSLRRSRTRASLWLSWLERLAVEPVPALVHAFEDAEIERLVEHDPAKLPVIVLIPLRHAPPVGDIVDLGLQDIRVHAVV